MKNHTQLLKSIAANLIAINEITIVSGERKKQGTVEVYNGRRSLRAIKMRLTEERCGGKRWAYARVFYQIDRCGIEVFLDVVNGKYYE